MDLTPIGEPPFRGSRWCPMCRRWIDACGVRRCPDCHTAVVRPPYLGLRELVVKPKPGELRPGIIAQFDDPRDRYDPTRALAEMRTRLRS